MVVFSAPIVDLLVGRIADSVILDRESSVVVATDGVQQGPILKMMLATVAAGCHGRMNRR